MSDMTNALLSLPSNTSVQLKLPAMTPACAAKVVELVESFDRFSRYGITLWISRRLAS